jgi:hypothetical protein
MLGNFSRFSAAAVVQWLPPIALQFVSHLIAMVMLALVLVVSTNFVLVVSARMTF